MSSNGSEIEKINESVRRVHNDFRKGKQISKKILG